MPHDKIRIATQSMPPKSSAISHEQLAHSITVAHETVCLGFLSEADEIIEDLARQSRP